MHEGTVSFNLRWTHTLVNWIFISSSRVQVEFCTLVWNKSNIKSAYSQDLLYFRDTEWCTCIIIVFDRKWVMSLSWYYEHCTKVLYDAGISIFDITPWKILIFISRRKNWHSIVGVRYHKVVEHDSIWGDWLQGRQGCVGPAALHVSARCQRLRKCSWFCCIHAAGHEHLRIYHFQ